MSNPEQDPLEAAQAALEAEVRTVVEGVAANLPGMPLDIIERISERIIRFQMEQREHEAGPWDDCHLYPDPHTVADHRNPPDYSTLDMPPGYIESAGHMGGGFIQVEHFDPPPGMKVVLDPNDVETPLKYEPKD